MTAEIIAVTRTTPLITLQTMGEGRFPAESSPCSSEGSNATWVLLAAAGSATEPYMLKPGSPQWEWLEHTTRDRGAGVGRNWVEPVPCKEGQHPILRIREHSEILGWNRSFHLPQKVPRS